MTLPTAEQIETVLKHLPTFQKHDAELSKEYPFRENGNEIELPWVELSDEVEQFINDLYVNNFIQQFDWSRWQSKASRYIDGPSMLGRADVNTLVKLLTLHVRKDRFCEGHFASMVRCGHIRKVLERLQEVQQAAKKS